MEYKKLKEYWLSEEKKSFQGWDFSYIEKRETHEPLPWDYDKFVRQYLNSNSILLDMGTGGGEYLLTLNHPYFKTFATEAYLPNFELCERTLTPLGIDVRQVSNDDYIPFENEMFDIILNRHRAEAWKSNACIARVVELFKKNFFLNNLKHTNYML